ncbi:hypothetical protein Hanom_Chr16g01472331 [Helianthus anomalus]
MSMTDDVVTVEEAGGGLPPLEWDQVLLEQWATDVPPGYIILFADFFGEGDFRLPATHVLGDILQYYGFHISLLSPMGMVRIQHFEFVCRSQGEQPTVERFRAFYRFFHNWEMKFFYIRAEEIPIVMQFRDMGTIPKEDLKIPRDAAWYEKLWRCQTKSLVSKCCALPSRVPSPCWCDGCEAPAQGEEYWSEQIPPNFMYVRVELFATPPVATEGAHNSNPSPCRAITPAGIEVVYLSSEELVASSENELKPPHDVFAGVLRNLGIDHEENKPKRVSMKQVTVAKGVAHKKPEVMDAASDAASHKGTARIRQRSLDDFVYVADSFEEIYAIGGKPQGSMVADARSSLSAGSKDPPSGATPTFTPAEETEADPGNVKLIRKNSSKRPCEETKSEASPRAKKVASSKPAIGKKRSLRMLSTGVSTGTCFILGLN